MAGVWMVAGALKIPDPQSSVQAVQAYQVLPADLARTVGYGLPVIEVVLGLCLLVGLFVRPASVISAGLLVLFIAAITSVWARGINIDCGCFGGGGTVSASQTNYPVEIARDSVLLALSLMMVWLPRSHWAVDNLLGVPTGEPRSRRVKSG
jgi:uncharacterized membrane protein YphA (DoxX/SURF4 family)